MYCKSKRFRLTAFRLFVVRLVTFLAYTALVAFAGALIGAPTSGLNAGGLLLFLFLADRALHAGEGDVTIRELERSRDRNVSRSFTPRAHDALARAVWESRMLRTDFLMNLARLLTKDRDVKEALQRLGIPPDVFFRDDASFPKTPGSVHLAEELGLVAFGLAAREGEDFVCPRNLFDAVMRAESAPLRDIRIRYDVTPDDVAGALLFGRFRPLLRFARRVPATIGGFAYTARTRRKRIMNRAWTARPTPFLDALSTDLTSLVRRERVGFLVGHAREFDALVRALSRPGKPNALLVGPPGVGKSSLVAHLAFRIARDDIDRALFDKRVVELDIGRVIANARTEEVAGRLKRVADEIIAAGNILLVIPDVHQLFKSVSYEGGLTPVDILLPIVRDADIPVVCMTYPEEFSRIEGHGAFLELFEKIDVSEISQEEAFRILAYYAVILEKQERVFIRFKALRRCVALAYRYLHEKPLPASAIDLLKECIVSARRTEKRRPTVYEETVYETVESLSKIPVERPRADEAERLLNLESIIHERLVDQDTAVSAVSDALREYRSGLSRKGAPIASFLFVGPTGVGKTELAKILSRVQFGSPAAMIRLDMSEYQSDDSVDRLIATLTRAVRAQPYALVLLDEFEKAHPDILNLFLQVFDDGRLTDAAGRTVSFEHTIIIATSNADSAYIKESVERGKTMEDLSHELKRRLTSYFKPELLNRFSRVVVFKTLSREETKVIAGLLLRETEQMLTDAHGVTLSVTDAALGELAEVGYSPSFGARPLREAIGEHIRGKVADMLLRNEVRRGDTITVDCRDHEFIFETHTE